MSFCMLVMFSTKFDIRLQIARSVQSNMQCNYPTVINTSLRTLTCFPYLPDECTLDLDALPHSLQISQSQGLLAQYLESILLYKTSQKGRKLIRVTAFVSQQCQPGFRCCIHVQL